MKTILSIQSQVSGARVGNSVAAFAIERLGVRCFQLPTTLLGRRPDRGAPGGGPTTAETLGSMIDGLAADELLGEIDAVLTGYLGQPSHVAVILDAVERIKAANPKAIFVCDPVLGDDGKLYVGDDLANAMIQGLAPHADWLTPNAFELGLISGRTIDGLPTAREAARRLNKPVLVSSIRTAIGLGNLYTAPSSEWFCETARLPRAPKGAGDLLSALFVARRVRGDAPAIALEGATGGVYDVIVRSLAAESEDLLLPEAQDVLAEPVTWPRAAFGTDMSDGVVAPGFERVREAFDAQLAEEIGAGFAATRDGEVIVDIWGGWADRAQTRAWAQDTIVPAYSTTKGVSAVVMALLADRGLLDYEAATASVWPAFGAHGKDRVTIAQTLAHQAGVPGFLEPIDNDLWLDPPACAEAIAALAPLWPPGSASGYHPLTWGYIVGELALLASGRSLGTILREDICTPLGLDFSIGTPASEHPRAAEIKKPSQGGDFGEITPPRKAAFFTPWASVKRGGPRWREIEIPSANGHGTALAVARLYEVYATGGLINGARVLSQEGHDALTKRRWKGDDLVLPYNIDWRTGIIGNSNRIYGPNPEAFGHSGHGGSFGSGDPVAGVSIGYVMNKQSHHIMADPRALKLIDALYSCL